MICLNKNKFEEQINEKEGEISEKGRIQKYKYV